MLKFLLLLLPLFSGTVTAQGNDVIIEKLDGSHFQRTDIFQGKVSGQGKCTVSGSRNWNGGCSLEQFTMGPLNRYDIYLNDGKSYYRIVQNDPGNNDLYHT